MVHFKINEKVIECLGTDTILEVKKEIIKQLDLPCKYIDMSFVLDKPMRVLGKFNVEPGKLPRTLDRYVVERFAFKGEIKVEITEIEDYDPSIKKPLMSGGGGAGGAGINKLVYVAPSSRKESIFNHTSSEMSMKVDPTFNLDSQDDFPSL
tara:strand:+ start:91 stop:543 length:453 start_codon:yes stop_codon:yes gene_type:complete